MQQPARLFRPGGALAKLVQTLSDRYVFTALDVGCRRELCPDLRPVRALVDVVGFDADADATRPFSEGNDGWHSLRVLPTALGRENETLTLNLTRARGCSSLLAPNLALVRAFSRGERYEVEQRIDVTTRSLDRVAEEAGLADARYMKIDVQGWEQAVFEGAARLLRDELIAVRTEVSFRPTYGSQPLFADIDRDLQTLGFLPAGFAELHAWRRSTLDGPERLSPGGRPYSRGELMHGDIVYLRDPEALAARGPDVVERGIAAGMIGLVYGFVDYAGAIWRIPAVQDRLGDMLGHAPEQTVAAVSAELARTYRRRQLSEAWAALRRAVRGR